MIRPGTSTTAPPTVAQEEGVRTQSAPAGLFQEDIGAANEGRDSKNNLNENNLSTHTEDGKYSSEGAAREWSTVVIVIVIFIS